MNYCHKLISAGSVGFALVPYYEGKTVGCTLCYYFFALLGFIWFFAIKKAVCIYTAFIRLL